MLRLVIHGLVFLSFPASSTLSRLKGSQRNIFLRMSCDGTGVHVWH